MALLFSWNTQTAAQVDADSPITEDLMEGTRQNLIHLRQTVYGDGAGGFKTAADGHTHDGTDSVEVQTGQGGLKTSTASVSGSAAAGALTDIALADYSFSPMIHASSGTGTNHHFVIGRATDAGDTVGRFRLYNSHTAARNYTVRYRFVTASEGEQYAKFTNESSEVVMKAEFQDAPPDWEDVFDALASDNNFARVDITKEEFDDISFD